MKNMFTIKNGVLFYNNQNICAGMKISRNAFRNLKNASTTEIVIDLLKKMGFISSFTEKIGTIPQPNSIIIDNYECLLW